jgi:hypothetical protein
VAAVAVTALKPLAGPHQAVLVIALDLLRANSWRQRRQDEQGARPSFGLAEERRGEATQRAM